MAYYLNNDGISNARIDLSSTIFIGGTVGDYIEFDVEANAGNVNDAYRIAAGETTNFRAILEVGPTQVFFRPDNNVASSFTTNYTQPPVGQRFTVKVERISSGVWKCFIDGISVGTSSNAQNFKIIQFGDFRHASNSAFQGKFYRVVASTNGGASITNDWNKQTLSGANDILLPDTVGGNDGTLVNFPADDSDSRWIFYDDGGGAVDPEPELHEFSGNAIVNALSFAQISKTAQHNGQALVNVSASGQFAKEVTLSGESLVTASASASSTKVVNTSGAASIKAQSVSLFEKLNTFSGNASVNATSQSSASKLVPFNGQATVDVIASASIIDGNFEIHSFSGGALITASASGQTVKVGLVSGSANVAASTSAQASKTAQLSGNATISTSTQSLFSKIASISGNALTRVTTLASAFKRVTLSGASRVFATAYGTFFNTESNVETYELTVQGRVKAPIVVQGTIKSLTIQGRVK